MAIAAQDAGAADYGRKTLADWHFDGDLSPVRAALGTELVMVIVFQEVSGWQYFGGGLAGGLSKAMVLNGRPPLALDRYGVACVTSLATGQMVWCKALVNKWRDVTKEEHARFAVTHLLAELYPSTSPPKPVPLPAQPRQGN
jgi:hypothetical protein